MTKNTNTSNSLPDYENPPVQEVACGIEFKHLQGFKASHIGIFWQKIRDQFPNCEHAYPLGFPQKPPVSAGDFIFPLPRLWFINKSRNGLVQLQNDRFYYNWRRMQTEEPYPRYSSVIKEFKNNLQIFEEFLAEEKLGTLDLEGLELTYINHIPKGDGWTSVAEIGEVLQDLEWKSKNNRFLPKPKQLKWETVFHMPEGKGRLYVKLETGHRKVDKLQLYILNISARGQTVDKGKKQMWNWFDLAHEWIVRGFADLTTEKIQQNIWRRL